MGGIAETNVLIITPKYHKINVLVVDDICHSGRTFEMIKYYDAGHHCFYASLFYRKESVVKPDLYLEETEDWIVFPWECYEEEPNR